MSRIKPILFNTDMARAIQDGTKTVTRRVMKPQPRAIYYDGKVYDDDGLYVVAENQNGGVEQIELPYRPGDILYVRETWANISDWTNVDPEVGLFDGYIYKADWEDGTEHPQWRPSIHMPREAARIFLRVTDVRVGRLQDITESQAIAEGCNGKFAGTGEVIGCGWEITPQDEFSSIWNSTIKPKDRTLYGWEANPWVWVIAFEKIRKEEAND